MSETRTIAESFTGHDALFAVRNGNGTFIGARVVSNTGTGQISDNTVLNGAAYLAHDFRIRFTSATSYDIIDDTLGSNVATGQAYTDGAAISFNGSQVTVFGAPNTGDEFTVRPSQNQSMFKTLGNITTYPQAGLLFMDFDRGATLQLTGVAKVIWGMSRTGEFPGAQRLVQFSLATVIEVGNAWPLRWKLHDYSPFNPDA